MSRSRGQATVEWTGLVLLIAFTAVAGSMLVARSNAIDLGRSIIDAIACAAGGGCPGGLEKAYGEELAGVVKRYAPNVVYERRSAELPIDFRRCRKLRCSNGLDRAGAVDESELGLPVTAFTHVIDQRPKGGSLYLQYWFYYPESFTGGIGRMLGPFAHDWPGFHVDDWEGYQVRIAPGNQISARATAHGGYRNAPASTGWGPWTGWYRVSGGSHAGHLVAGATGERTTPAAKLRLEPLERLTNTDLYRFAVTPPWEKAVYAQPESVSS
jgi:hypothetical protein